MRRRSGICENLKTARRGRENKRCIQATNFPELPSRKTAFFHLLARKRQDAGVPRSALAASWSQTTIFACCRYFSTPDKSNGPTIRLSGRSRPSDWKRLSSVLNQTSRQRKLSSWQFREPKPAPGRILHWRTAWPPGQRRRNISCSHCGRQFSRMPSEIRLGANYCGPFCLDAAHIIELGLLNRGVWVSA
jgi:hypothetical protein